MVSLISQPRKTATEALYQSGPLHLWLRGKWMPELQSYIFYFYDTFLTNVYCDVFIFAFVSIWAILFRFEKLRGLLRVQNTVLPNHMCHVSEWCVVTSEWHQKVSKHMLETNTCHCNVKNFSCHISHLFVFYFPPFVHCFILILFCCHFIS